MAEALDNTVTATGIENIPTKGPVVILSNHPGMTDTIALFSQIPRNDLKILADQREFLTLLPNTSKNLLYIELEKDAVANLGKVRALIRHLKNGGVILTFPAGTIEPDPAVATGALDSLNHWSDSIDLFTRLVPNCVVIPTLISGVISPRARNHPLTKLRKNPEDQDFLAAILQVMIPSYRRVNVHIAFGKPITANKKTAVSTQVKTAMQNLIRQIINR